MHTFGHKGAIKSVSTSRIQEVPHLGALSDGGGGCGGRPALTLPPSEPGYGERPLPLLQLDSELVEFHKGIGSVVFSVGLSLMIESEVGDSFGDIVGSGLSFPTVHRKTEGFPLVSSATGQTAPQPQRLHRERYCLRSSGLP